MKRNRLLLITVASCLIVIVAFVVGYLVYHHPVHYTTFQDGFDDQRFAEIRIGDSKTKIKERLGEPIGVTSGVPGFEIWRYSEPTATWYHSVGRSITIDLEDQTVSEIDRETRRDFVKLWWSGGHRHRKTPGNESSLKPGLTLPSKP